VYWFLKAFKLFFCLGSLRFSFQFGLLRFRSASLQRFIKLATFSNPVNTFLPSFIPLPSSYRLKTLVGNALSL
ncbi:hypothetical protein, partial [Pseudanabaena sp. UWO310]|uniref:hypothetical protein n=1 Tax=Pseudanabaena sp. UWO310 TaxID=2480795 RepID=UPI001CC1C44D